MYCQKFDVFIDLDFMEINKPSSKCIILIDIQMIA